MTSKQGHSLPAWDETKYGFTSTGDNWKPRQARRPIETHQLLVEMSVNNFKGSIESYVANKKQAEAEARHESYVNSLEEKKANEELGRQHELQLKRDAETYIYDRNPSRDGWSATQIANIILDDRDYEDAALLRYYNNIISFIQSGSLVYYEVTNWYQRGIPLQVQKNAIDQNGYKIVNLNYSYDEYDYKMHQMLSNLYYNVGIHEVYSITDCRWYVEPRMVLINTLTEEGKDIFMTLLTEQESNELSLQEIYDTALTI